MKDKNSVVKKAQKHVFDLFKENQKPELLFHNYSHTLEVVAAAEEIGECVKLPKDEMECLLLAAWFHDTGMLTTYENHEEASAAFAEAFLISKEFEPAKIATVTAAIKATSYPHNPSNLLEEALCDADLAYYGAKDYLDKAQLLRLEWSMVGVNRDDGEWPGCDIRNLSGHTYKTEYAQREYAARKGKNILALKALQDDRALKAIKEQERKQKDEAKKEVPERGIETMFRVALRNHMNLSAIADNKANIMLSINAIIISIALSSLLPNFDESPGLIIPTVILLLVCVVTMIFATLSTRPKVAAGKFTRDDVMNQKPNLLFFGNFHGMPLNEFEWGMEEMMKHRNFLYGSLIKDFYSLGTVLAVKYRYLRVCYNIFMYGMVVAVGSFLLMLLPH